MSPQPIMVPPICITIQMSHPYSSGVVYEVILSDNISIFYVIILWAEYLDLQHPS